MPLLDFTVDAGEEVLELGLGSEVVGAEAAKSASRLMDWLAAGSGRVAADGTFGSLGTDVRASLFVASGPDCAKTSRNALLHLLAYLSPLRWFKDPESVYAYRRSHATKDIREGLTLVRGGKDDKVVGELERVFVGEVLAEVVGALPVKDEEAVVGRPVAAPFVRRRAWREGREGPLEEEHGPFDARLLLHIRALHQECPR
jgi:hypothetical protein